MNILFCYKLDKLSGWGTLASNYIKFFSKNNLIILCNQKNQNIDIKQYEVLRHPLEYINNPFKFMLDRKIIKNILNKHNQYNNLNVHYLVEPYIFFDFLLKNFFKKRVFYLIGTYSNLFLTSLKWRFIFKSILSRKNEILFLSTYIKEILNKNFDFKSSKTYILNPYIDKLLDLKHQAIKKNINKLKIITVGAFKYRKGQLELIKIIGDIINKNKKKNIQLTLIGSADDRRYFSVLKKYIKTNKLNSKIFFKLNISDKDLMKEYAKSHLFILNSLYSNFHLEGYGIVYLEALSYGCDILVSKYSGALDLKKFFNNKIVFDSNDANDLKLKILKFLNRKKLTINIKGNLSLFNLINKTNQNKLKNFLIINKYI